MRDKLVHFLKRLREEFPSPNCQPNLTVDDDDQLCLSVPVGHQWMVWAINDDEDFDPDRLIEQMKNDLESISN